MSASRPARTIRDLVFLLAPILVIVLVWLPVLDHYAVDGPAVTDAAVDAGRTAPTDAVLLEERDFNLLSQDLGSPAEETAIAEGILRGSLQLPWPAVRVDRAPVLARGPGRAALEPPAVVRRVRRAGRPAHRLCEHRPRRVPCPGARLDPRLGQVRAIGVAQPGLPVERPRDGGSGSHAGRVLAALPRATRLPARGRARGAGAGRPLPGVPCRSGAVHLRNEPRAHGEPCPAAARAGLSRASGQRPVPAAGAGSPGRAADLPRGRERRHPRELRRLPGVRPRRARHDLPDHDAPGRANPRGLDPPVRARPRVPRPPRAARRDVAGRRGHGRRYQRGGDPGHGHRRGRCQRPTAPTDPRGARSWRARGPGRGLLDRLGRHRRRVGPGRPQPDRGDVDHPALLQPQARGRARRWDLVEGNRLADRRGLLALRRTGPGGDRDMDRGKCPAPGRRSPGQRAHGEPGLVGLDTGPVRRRPRAPGSRRVRGTTPGGARGARPVGDRRSRGR